jgi:hypothetical protein
MEPIPKTSYEALPYILGLIRAGTYPWVAARAAGVTDEAFRQFMAPTSPARAEIIQAEAQSRAKAEIDLKEKNPVAWLRYGPGRPRREGPGWTGVAKAGSDGAEDVNAFRDELRRIVAVIGEFAARHPDVAPAAAEVLGLLDDKREVGGADAESL